MQIASMLCSWKVPRQMSAKLCQKSEQRNRTDLYNCKIINNFRLFMGPSHARALGLCHPLPPLLVCTLTQKWPDSGMSPFPIPLLLQLCLVLFFSEALAISPTVLIIWPSAVHMENCYRWSHTYTPTAVYVTLALNNDISGWQRNL